MGSASTGNSRSRRARDLSLCCGSAALVTGETTEASTPQEIYLKRYSRPENICAWWNYNGIE